MPEFDLKATASRHTRSEDILARMRDAADELERESQHAAAALLRSRLDLCVEERWLWGDPTAPPRKDREIA